jgi:predicted nucleic-acid-binding Zn-ribbon protein
MPEKSVTLTLAQAVTMYEDHFKTDMDPKLAYQDAAKMVLDETGLPEFLKRLSFIADTGKYIIETVKGNAPECPKCGNWNAMLDGALATDNYRRFFECRDCGNKIFKDEVIIIIKEADKPGMGADTAYHEISRVEGEKY